MYKKMEGRMQALEQHGLGLVQPQTTEGSRFSELMSTLAETARENKMEIVSCAEELDLSAHGIAHGKCIDDAYIRKVFGIEVGHTKDPGQRKACGCVTSRDIGMYDSCLFGCQYCYATASFEKAKINHAEHNPESPSLLGWHEAKSASENLQLDMFLEDFDKMT
jgi:hypothetical protein